MDNKQFVITQGSTPSLEMCLPFEMPGSGTAFATFSQGDAAVLEYGLNGTPTAGIAGTGTLALDTEDSSMLVLSMSQTDTLSLTHGDVELQVRVKTDDGADTYFPLIGEVIRAAKQGVIT